MVWGTRYFSFLFDAAGLYHFKSRFRPQFESRYVCVFPKVTLGSALAFVGLLDVLKLDLRKSLRIAADRLRKWAMRSTLANRQSASVSASTAE
jgi:phosphatidylglycerol lysyltransferase